MTGIFPASAKSRHARAEVGMEVTPKTSPRLLRSKAWPPTTWASTSLAQAISRETRSGWDTSSASQISRKSESVASTAMLRAAARPTLWRSSRTLPLPCKVTRAISAVRSTEPSDTTTTSDGGSDWSSAERRACAIVLSASRAATITATEGIDATQRPYCAADRQSGQRTEQG